MYNNPPPPKTQISQQRKPQDQMALLVRKQHSDAFYEVSIILFSEPDNDAVRKENDWPISSKLDARILPGNPSK